MTKFQANNSLDQIVTAFVFPKTGSFQYKTISGETSGCGLRVEKRVNDQYVTVLHKSFMVNNKKWYVMLWAVEIISAFKTKNIFGISRKMVRYNVGRSVWRGIAT